MANHFEEGMAHATKSLSFIDWDCLDNDEYDKLSRIINTSNKSSGVQLLFVEEQSDNCEEENSDKSGAVEETFEPVKVKGVVDVENSILHPAAPVFQPSIPPPTMMPFPIAVPHHWPHADPNMPPPQPQANPYSYHHVPGGYVFHPDPNLCHNVEATVAFVTLSNGQSAYAFPGHPIPAHHFQPTSLASGIPPLPNAAAAHHHIPPQGDMMLHPVSGAVIPTTPSHHPLFTPHITTTMGQPLPAHMVPPHTVSQHIPHNQHSTQYIYIPQMPPVSVAESRDSSAIETNNEPVVVNSPPKEKEEEKHVEEQLQPESSKTSATPHTPSKHVALSEIEFGGPVVFDTEPVVSNSSPLEQTPSKSSRKDKTKQSPPSVQEVTTKEKVNSAPDLPSKANDKAKESTTITVPESKTIVERVHIQESSIDSAKSSSVNKTQSSNVNERPISNMNSSHSSTANVNTTPQPPNVNSAPNVNSSTTKEESPEKMASEPSPKESENKVEPDSTSPAPVYAPAAPKTWSSLFGKSSPNVPSNSSSPVSPSTTPEYATTNVESPKDSNGAPPEVKSVRFWQEQDRQKERERTEIFPLSSKKIKAVGVRQDPLAPKLLTKLSDFPISHIPIIVQPRGLKNGNNICFMNATLQVLMGCPPFIHLFRAFRNLPARSGGNSSTPVFDALVLFVNAFQNCQRTRQQGPPKTKKAIGYDINVGVPFIPESLLAVAQHILGLKIGVQHDAEEFLSQILSICNEEVENIIKMKNMDSLNNNSASNGNTAKKMNNGNYHQNGDVNEVNNHHIQDGEDDGDESWVQVGPRNHCVETSVNNCGQTPLSAIFAGLSRSCLVRESGKTSDTLDSFFTLKLDIQAESVHSVRDALARLNATEEVQDVDGKKVDGHRRMFFEVLPPVLIMHLKLFEYSNGNGQKIQKKISFDVDLQVPKEILSRVGRSKYPALKSRSYKLFGVVNHHGTKMNDGHYTSDVFLPIVNGWLHFDDSDVSISDEATVLHYGDKKMPYLLFYRRMDV